MTTQADTIIAKFGGIHATARALKHENTSTVQGWRMRGFIPGKQHQKVWDAARKAGVKLDLADFAAVYKNLK